ncbi:baseplate wedge subunit protein [Rhizobium phage RHph_TM39]|uniref:Baseplate wedge subunit protein n=2 Tax=Cuauhnahuacvirus TaxID=3044696 RepID=A0A7S5RCD2_9CAUD|nr:tail sheath [Rhizobium phage RHph_TM30]YP_010671492.1 tail sheath [Rhizobium phage RHph_Y65]QIG71815.1 baseplate wedge subunit protein [Rhizobium phage RHph_TM40]QIG72175.1 baseplate wedge subunit protein [Rhizobium phage RHph_TM2_3B]QIG72538.1 baseplate wedge subunit protein [Rhizobium phage RHph_TM3_3_6]QIG77307.1 baseplate wedge subunit protein [Rhizobium phage RHph_TM39]QIG71451.1 baseplate wedge subunit protein [Rhizobium phage RHph_TM30]
MAFKINYDANVINRYDQAKFMPYSEDMYDILDSTFMDKLRTIGKYGVFTVTSEDGRPDLIAEKIYGLGYSQYWWILMLYNDIVDPEDIVTGTVIRYPSVSTLENIYFSLVPGVSS